MNREIKDCIESLTGEFKRADKQKLKEWINLQTGHKNLVQAICLIEAKVMEDIVNLTIDSHQDSADQIITCELPCDKSAVRAILGTIKNCNGIAENTAIRTDLAEGYLREDKLKVSELRTLFHKFNDGVRIFIKYTELFSLVNDLNAHYSDEKYSINYKIEGDFVYLIRINPH